MAKRKLPHEGGPTRGGFFGPWQTAATIIYGFNAMVCSPSPLAWAYGTWMGALHMMIGLACPIPFAPSLGMGEPGIPHGGRRGGRNREPGKPKASFKSVFNLPAASEFELDAGYKLALFELGGIALEVGYVIFLASLFRDSLVTGTTAAYRFQGCIPAAVGPANAKATGNILGPGGKQAVLWSTVSDPSGLIDVDRWVIPGGSGMAAAYGCTVSPFSIAPHSPGSMYFYLVDVTTGAIVSGCGASSKPGKDGSSNKVANSFTLPWHEHDRTYQLVAVGVSGWSEITDGFLAIGTTEQLEGGLIPGCSFHAGEK